LLLSSATLIEAVYEAAAAEPDNPQARATLAVGVQHITVFDPRTPVDVLNVDANVATAVSTDCHDDRSVE
jgi:hypothetical protein